MHRVRHCKRCKRLFTHNCPHCTRQGELVGAIHLGRYLFVDVAITLRVDHRNRPFLLIQKPSGQEQVSLQPHDIYGDVTADD